MKKQKYKANIVFLVFLFIFIVIFTLSSGAAIVGLFNIGLQSESVFFGFIAFSLGLAAICYAATNAAKEDKEEYESMARSFTWQTICFFLAFLSLVYLTCKNLRWLNIFVLIIALMGLLYGLVGFFTTLANLLIIQLGLKQFLEEKYKTVLKWVKTNPSGKIILFVFVLGLIAFFLFNRLDNSKNLIECKNEIRSNNINIIITIEKLNSSTKNENTSDSLTSTEIINNSTLLVN